MLPLAIIPTLIEFARQSVSGGYLISLSLVCLLQYLLYLYRMTRIRQEHARVSAALQELENQFRETQRDCSVATVENDLLRDFIAAPPTEQLVQTLLQRLVPDLKSGWAAYIALHPEPHVLQNRGLLECPPDVVDLEDSNLTPLWSGLPVIFRDPRVAKSGFLLNFGSADRNRSGSQLYVFGVRHGERCFGLLVTSSLFPADVPVEQQTELVQRLCTGLARHLEALEIHAVQEQELRVSADRLALRNLFDHHFETPLQLTQQFVRSLQTRLNAESVVLFSARSADGTESLPIFSGGPPTIEMRELYQHLETSSGSAPADRSRGTLFDEYALLGMGLQHEFRSAILMPVATPLKPIGMLCVTRSSGEQLSTVQQNLVQWATDLYVEKLTFLIQHTEVSRLAKLDTVTQIANRRVFDSELERELQIAYATSSELSLILFDIDRFKSINDSHGHPAGDQVLRVFGGILRDCLSHLRAGDRGLCARYGGDEFAVILPGMGPLGAARIGELIRQHLLHAKIAWQETKLHPTVSGGFATYPENGLTSQELIAAADTALFKSKAGGRNAISWPELAKACPGSTDRPETTNSPESSDRVVVSVVGPTEPAPNPAT